MLNNVTLIGRMATDPELKYTANGKAVCNFVLAVDRDFKSADGERETDFITIVAWQHGAEFAANYLTKGDLVGIAGRIQIRPWQTTEGEKRKSFEVVANQVKGLSGKKSGGAAPESSGDAAASAAGGGGKASSNGKPKAQAAPAPVSVASPVEDEEMDFHDPFADM